MLLRQRESLLENDGSGCRFASTDHQDATAVSRRDAIEWPLAFVGYLLGSPLELVGCIDLPQRRMGEALHHTAHQQQVLDGGADRGAGVRSHQSRAGSPKRLLRFPVTAGDEIGLSETIFGKVEP